MEDELLAEEMQAQVAAAKQIVFQVRTARVQCMHASPRVWSVA